MAIKIRFDNEDNIIDPTIVLMSRSAVKYGSLQYNGLKAKINFNSYSELSFNVDKSLCSEDLWGKLVDFKLIWVKDWNACFEINVDINEDNGISKTITAKSLGESELAQVNLYNIEVNTEDDIERSDYVPTILYNEENHKASLIHRLLEKCPHYRIGHIDSSIAGAQRTFQFNNQSIIDAFDTISKEIDCVFIINCSINAEGDLVRTINIYDLEFSCVDCGHRWEHIADTCPSCNGTNINTGYGEDTHIFISSKNLAQQINYTTSTGSVKNCFKLQAGDDLMTSAVINCNPNGGQYLWYISDEVKEDMSDELSQKIDEYEDLCEYYQNEYQVDISSDDVNNYNRIIQKYSIYSQDHEQISLPIVGYSDLVKNLYNVLDFDIYLSNELMPTPQMINTTAEEQVAKLTTQSLSPVSVTDLSNLSLATANNVVLGMARVIVDNRYKITIVNSTLSNNTWQGSFCVTNYSNDDDTSTSGNINITINDDYENFLKQKIDKALQKSMTTNEAIDIVGLFKLGISDFTNEIKKYSLSILKSFYDNCQTCLDVLIEQGIANGETWGDKNPNLYTELYIPYRNKLTAIESEIALRESEIKVVKDIEDYLYDIKGDVQASLNLQAFLGDNLWEQFSAYRREDTYQNDNYISDGLGNSEMFEKAKAFIAEAQKNIYKSANLQHSISSTLKNLLMLREFQTLKDYFEEGNWLRIETDGEINRLRLMSYEVDYENTNDLSVEFSDVSKLKDGISDIQSVLDNSKSIASSFNAVTRQAKNGNDSRKTIDKWINSGIALNNIKIIQDAENQNVIFDNNGILCREYLPMTNSYDDRQLKIINKGLFLTDDNWQSAKVGIGEIEYNGEKSYGVNAQLLIGDIIIGNELHIKDSQGQDILTVIDGRISTEVSEVKSAAASGTFEYYDPSNLSWTEQGNVDYFGYGLIQDETETDTGVKAAGNNNKYFLNKHNGNLYKSNGTKWVFQKTLSPRFDNYSTIAYTDNKAGTAESNAIANTTSQVNSAKSTIAGATSKYDTSGQTITYYGYGTPNISGASSGQKYLDQDSGYVYTKGSGSTWTKSSTPLTLISTKVAQDAATDATNKANAAEGNAKTYAEEQATQAKNDAIADTVNKLKNYSTTTQMNTAITESAESIRLAASKAVSKYDITNKTVNFYAYGLSDDLTTTDTGIKATGNSGKFVLNQTDGKLYKSNGSKWVYQETLTTITDKLDSKITVTAEGIRSDVSANYSTKTYAENQASTAESNAKTYAEEQANTAESNAKTYAEVKASAAESNAITNATNQVSTAKATIASSTLKYDETGITVNYYGYGAPTEIAGATQGKIYLDQNEGYYYTKGSGSNWTKSSSALPLYADQKANAAKSEAISAASADATQKANQAEENAIADATNQVNNATTTIANATNKYDTTGLTITYFGYGVPDIATATSGQKYLDQNDGYVYTKKSGSGWTKSSTALKLVTTKVAEDASADASSKANTAESNAIANATNQVNNATTTIANAVSKYDTTGLTISYYGYGTPDISTATSGQKYLDQDTGYVYTKNSGSGWTKSASALTLITTKVATDAANDATTKANNAISTAATDATAKANTAENNAKTAAANAMSKYDEGSLTINYYGFGMPTTVAGSSQGEIYLDQNTGYYYTKGSGSTWTKSTNALPLYADQKATEAYNNALSYVGTYYITSEDANTTINQTKKEIEMKAAKAVSKYEIPVGITINYAGYGTPTVQGVKATAANQYYLDQETGNLYKSDSNKNWSSTPVQSLTIITDNLNSKITQTSEQISLEANARLEATVGYTSKNRLELTIDTQTVQGVTFTVDKTNGTITANGTSTGMIDVSIPISPDLSGDYYYSGVPDGGSGSTYYMYPWDVTSVSRPKKFDGVTPCLDDYGGTSQEIKFIKGHKYRLNIRIQVKGFVANNLIFRPMVRDRAFADDDTFEPFANVQSVTTNLQSQITQNANQIQLKVSAGDVCSVISQSSDTITLSSGRLIINSGNFQLDSNGNATLAGGVIRSANYVADTSGTEIDLSNGVIDSKNFKLDSNGRMSASAGDFGGWEIGSEWVGDTWDHYIESTKNQYGSIRWHSIHYGDYPSGESPEFITALDIKDPDGETLFRVAMDGSISTKARLDAHEASFEHASLGEYGYTGEEHLELRTGDLDSQGGYPPSYIKFYDASGNETLSLFTWRIRLNDYDTNGKIITQCRIDSTEISMVQNNSDETEKYKSTLTPIFLNFIDHTNQSSLGIKFNNDIAFYWYNNAVQCGISNKPLKLLGSAITANGSPVAVSSDERVKKDIEDLDDRYLSIIKNVKPKKFKYDDSIALSGRTHTGYIAQELKQAIEGANLTTKELAAFVDLNGDGSEYAIRYDEIIPLLHTWIKDIEERLSTIEKERK